MSPSLRLALPLLLCSLAVALTLAACAPVGPDYQPPQPSLPQHWENTAQHLSSDDAAALRQWWHLFGDARLDALINQAMAANNNAAMALSRIQEARAQSRIAGAERLPAVDLGSGYTHSRKSDNISSGGTRQDLFQLNFDVSWEVDFFGGKRRQQEAAEATLAATIEDYRDVLVSLSAEVARQYIELRAAQQRLIIARKNLLLQEQTLNLTQERLSTGIGNQLEISQARTQLSLLQAQLPPQEISEAQARHQLAILLGQQPQDFGRDLRETAPLPRPPTQLPTLLPSTLLLQRPDLRAAERQLAAANAAVGVATADLFPKFSLTALVGLQSNDHSQLITSGSRYWSLGPAIQWPLFDGGRTRAALDIKEAQLDQARLTYQNRVLTALAEVEDALVAVEREQLSRQRYSEAVAASQLSSELAQHQYTAGLNTFLNVLLANGTLAQSEDKLIQSEQRHALAMVALYKAMGGGWTPATSEAHALPSPSPSPSSRP